MRIRSIYLRLCLGLVAVFWVANLLAESQMTFLLDTMSFTTPLKESSNMQQQQHSSPHPLQALMNQSGKNHIRVFVNYAFSEDGARKDSVDNLRFFLQHGVTAPSSSSLIHVDYGLTINGNCTHAECLTPHLFVAPNPEEKCPRKMKILQRANAGYDFGAHTAMLDMLDAAAAAAEEDPNKDTTAVTTRAYDAFIFLNDGVVGPIVPAYMPNANHGWHWTRAFLDRFKTKEQGDFRGEVGLVGTSIVCLPPHDRGGFGPKVEGFVFAISQRALQIVRTVGTSFRAHNTKVDAILSGEYNLTSVLLAHDVNIDCLLKAYQNIDWRNRTHWKCNNMQHPTRQGTYFGSSINPLEVMFHKPNWAGKPPVTLEDLNLYRKADDESRERQMELRGNPKCA